MLYNTELFSVLHLQQILSLEELDLSESNAESIKKKLTKIYNTILFCLEELGIWMAMKVLIQVVRLI